MTDSLKPFRCGHDRTPENSMRRSERSGECLTCHRERIYAARADKASRGPRKDSRAFGLTVPLSLPPLTAPRRDPNANQGRSYSLAPNRRTA